ncbi:uncharacterized protein LOC110028523 [Phalaenopsis equestris]|uniref:uncharacterized protein LOC110028523 n=1 Tax=Phalaenopsis equestris TaxID=78828 RepID=UPI0009E4C86E|nr:uncharacterized protein LOC110028523 [Phalaenopsis equestris]
MEDHTLWYTSPDFLIKVAIFALIQGLVYLILTKSSAVFSAEERNRGSHRIRPSRSASIRRLLAGVSEPPAGGDFASGSRSLLLPAPPRCRGRSSAMILTLGWPINDG